MLIQIKRSRKNELADVRLDVSLCSLTAARQKPIE
jgi:hypothetical protein